MMKPLMVLLLSWLLQIGYAQEQIDLDWILIGKSHEEFKDFVKQNDIRDRLVGGKGENDSTFGYYYENLMYSRYIKDNRYQYVARSVRWIFVNDTIVSQVFNRLDEGILNECNSKFGKHIKSQETIRSTSIPTYIWDSKKINTKLYSYQIFRYLVITDKKEVSQRKAHQVVDFYFYYKLI